MSESQRLRPSGPNPLRYQGGLRHYHVAPPRPEVTWEQWIGASIHGRRRKAWLAAALVAAAIAAAVIWT